MNCLISGEVAEIGHLHDDVILLLLPESFRVVLLLLKPQWD